MNKMDEQGLFDKVYQFAMLFVGGLVSFFFHRQKKMNDAIENLDRRLDMVEINQAGYNKSVDYLIKRFDKMETNIEKMIEKDNK